MGKLVGLRMETMKRNHAEVYRMLPDDSSITDPAIFSSEPLAGSKQITGAYLLGLAYSHKWRLASFDRSLPWQAVRGADRSLIAHPGIA